VTPAAGAVAGHRPALDGLRGAAVLAVVAYHDGTAGLSGGFLGVDVFFVLSGLLITALLLGRPQSVGNLWRFWAARLRRLVPALAVTLMLVAGWAAWLAPPELAGRVRADGLAALGWVLNWRYVATGQSYFDQFLPSPLRHLWSLGVEMQWYVVWPLVVALVAGVLGAVGRRRHLELSVARLGWVLAGVAGAGAVVATGAMAAGYDYGADPSRLYYGTDTHATPLLVGAALGAVLVATGRLDLGRSAPGPASPQDAAWPPVLMAAAAAAGVVGAVGLGVAMVGATGSGPFVYRGGFALVAVATAGVLLAAVAPATSWWANPVGALLSVAPLRWLGLVSYGVYLLHWPVQLALTPATTPWSGWTLLAVRSAVTLLLATASLMLVERPVRTGVLAPLVRRPAVAAAALVAVSGVLLAGTRSGAPTMTDAAPVAFATDSAPLPAASAPLAGGATGGDVATARSPDSAVSPRPGPRRVLLVGDSVTWSLGAGFADGVDGETGLSVWNQGVFYCELVTLPRRWEGGLTDPAWNPCDDWPAVFSDLVGRFDPEVVVLGVGPWEVWDRYAPGGPVPFASPAFDSLFTGILDEAVDVLTARGATLVLLASPPIDQTLGTPLPEWTAAEAWRVEHLNGLLGATARRHGDAVTVVDLNELVCPRGVCDAPINGVVLRSDGVHFGAEGAPVAARWLAGRLPGPP